jgi:hypothetical protein
MPSISDAASIAMSLSEAYIGSVFSWSVVVLTACTDVSSGAVILEAFNYICLKKFSCWDLFSYMYGIVACKHVAGWWTVHRQERNAPRPWWRYATIEALLLTAFSVGPLRGYMTRPTEFSSVSECSFVQWSEVSWMVSNQLEGSCI